jgi:biopolymer transport protein ExbD
MGFHEIKVQEEVACNLVPMIDIMFLLLLFFMLGADMSQRENIDLKLPKADKVPEPKNVEDADSTTINIYHGSEGACAVADNGGICRDTAHWRWSVSGVEYTHEQFKQQLAILAQDYPEDAIDKDAGKLLSKRKILIRADEASPYGDVQKVIEYCGLAGLYKTSVGANRPLPETPGEKPK